MFICFENKDKLYVWKILYSHPLFNIQCVNRAFFIVMRAALFCLNALFELYCIAGSPTPSMGPIDQVIVQYLRKK